ncbi:MAG: hypothetical protein DRH03_11525 [Deltaproteobacteria bacterium]|nr:MAG: hypothetical protein DRH03_11525 [Deltaproteobacteria bacterium]
MTYKQTAIFWVLFICAAFCLLASCNRIPFIPRLEIDSFAQSNDSIETMEVKGVIYVRVINPQNALDPETPPAIWVPAQVYRSGKYSAYTVDLPKPAAASEIAAKSLNDKQSTIAMSADSSSLTTETSAEEELLESPPEILSLRRRALLFPSRVSLQHPEITTLLTLELENKLPLRIADCHDQNLLNNGRLLNQRSEITTAVKTWLKNSPELPMVQFIIFLSTSSGRKYQYYTCSWIDAQTGITVAAFSFRANPAGELLLPLVPNDPVPLEQLVDSTLWWCRIKPDDQENRYLLEAGHRSNLGYGHKLQVFAQADLIKDPQNSNKLGFAFKKSLGVVSIIDFFGADGCIAQALTPLANSFDYAYAVATTETEVKNLEKNDPGVAQ